MLSPIAPASLAGLRQLADKMEKILLVALESYGNTFVEPKVELGARFGHLVRKCPLVFPIMGTAVDAYILSQSPIPRYLPSYPGPEHGVD